jgi:2-polyprenyl-3-methyl-5-hydroxy-6-metoxy-1,4-benzoquinol methylase
MDSIPTDNHYQSIALGAERTPGFRSPRHELLDQIRFEDKKVLDLGSNLGELSRAARARGAALVDGYEYDPYFVQLANVVNAYNGVTRVSFFDRDITATSTYSEPYDVILAFSVYVYIRPVLALVTSMANELLVLETHRLEDNLNSQYIAPVLQFMPHHRILGESEWSASDLDAGTRVVVAFARSESALESGLASRDLTDGRVEAVPSARAL